MSSTPDTPERAGTQGATRDPGLQPERTALAWLRTGIVAAVVGAAASFLASHRPGGAAAAVAFIAGLCAAASTAMVLVSATGVSARGLGSLRSPWLRLSGLAAICVLLAAAGAVLALA